MTGSHSKKIDTEMKQYLEDELVEAAQAQLKASRDAVLGDQERAIMTSTRSVLRSAAQRATPPRFKQEIADIAATVIGEIGSMTIGVSVDCASALFDNGAMMQS